MSVAPVLLLDAYVSGRRLQERWSSAAWVDFPFRAFRPAPDASSLRLGHRLLATRRGSQVDRALRFTIQRDSMATSTSAKPK